MQPVHLLGEVALRLAQPCVGLDDGTLRLSKPLVHFRAVSRPLRLCLQVREVLLRQLLLPCGLLLFEVHRPLEVLLALLRRVSLLVCDLGTEVGDLAVNLRALHRPFALRLDIVVFGCLQLTGSLHALSEIVAHVPVSTKEIADVLHLVKQPTDCSGQAVDRSRDDFHDDICKGFKPFFRYVNNRVECRKRLPQSHRRFFVALEGLDELPPDGHDGSQQQHDWVAVQ